MNDFTLNESKEMLMEDETELNNHNLGVQHFDTNNFQTPYQLSHQLLMCEVNQIIQDTEPSFAKQINVPTEPQSHIQSFDEKETEKNSKKTGSRINNEYGLLMSSQKSFNEFSDLLNKKARESLSLQQQND